MRDACIKMVINTTTIMIKSIEKSWRNNDNTQNTEEKFKKNEKSNLHAEVQ
jgi:hypothetical protein